VIVTMLIINVTQIGKIFIL